MRPVSAVELELVGGEGLAFGVDEDVDGGEARGGGRCGGRGGLGGGETEERTEGEEEGGSSRGLHLLFCRVGFRERWSGRDVR